MFMNVLSNTMTSLSFRIIIIIMSTLHNQPTIIMSMVVVVVKELAN